MSLGTVCCSGGKPPTKTRGANLAMLVVVNDFVAQEKRLANLLVEGNLMFGWSAEPQLNGVVLVVVH